MLNFKNALAAATMAIGIAGAAPASAAIYGGIDFTDLGNGTHLETATLAQTFVNGNGQNAQAYGLITSVNGSTAYCAVAPCTLYYVANFNTSQNFSAGYVEFTSATVSVYYSNQLPANLLASTSTANIAAIQSATPWLSLTGHNNLGGVASPNAVLNGAGVLTGTSLSGSGFGLFDVNPGGAGLADVIAALNSNGATDAIGGKADLALTSSFNNLVLNPRDVTAGLANGCQTGNAAPGAWCYQGTSNFRGVLAGTVPEPGALGVLGLSMLGIVGFMRRRKS